MAQIALPREQMTQTSQSRATGSSLYQRRSPSQTGPVELLPNPDFTFPMQDPDRSSPGAPPASSASNSRPLSLQAYPTARRGSAHAMRQKSVSALPDFSFNPAGPPQAPTAASSPPLSPMATPTTPSRPIGGHRRGGSEFIGGDGRSGGVSLMSTSPTKGDDVLPPPNSNLRPGPPPGRRGHAHRRSGAVSSHDLSSIMNPPAPSRTGSAPVTPSEGNQFAFGHSVNKSMSQPSLRDASSLQDADNAQRPPSRARVGFSDRVEYIRPLSTISSETETSMSTVRGHSATNSLSSVISASASSPKSGRASRSALSVLEDEGRPSTAGAILDKQTSIRFPDDVNQTRPSSAISPTTLAPPNACPLPAKRRSFFRLEPRRSDPSVPTLSSVSDPSLSVPMDSPLPSPSLEEEGSSEPGEKTKARKSNRAPRKVKSWASSIIPKKSKHSKKVKGRAPTPPPESPADGDSDESEDVDFEANFDVDNTVTIVSPTDDAAAPPKLQTDFASWQPRELKRVDSDTLSPVIDLDAALGPFNTPQGASARGQRGFGAHRRAMHSAGGLLQSHRRTESAPELVPFELRNVAATSTSKMADVFEEEEPEEEASPSEEQSPSGEAPSKQELEDVEPKIQVVEIEGVHTGSSINWNFNDGLGLKRTDKPRKQEPSEPCSPRTFPEQLPSLTGPAQPPNTDTVEVVEDFEEPRTSSLTHSSDSTVTPSEESKEAHTVMNLTIPLPQQNLMTPDTFASSFSSPDFRSSQVSLDTPRLGTAASSMTDYQAMPSPRFGEPGPELRVSVDDVPSLTSSRSTMTSGMQNAFPLPSPRRPGDRSASLCSAPSDVESRRRKRSSIASLSRLINNSSFGERSKLSIETRPQSEYLQPTHRESKKKHKRLSKLMQFWKPKQSSRT